LSKSSRASDLVKDSTDDYVMRRRRLFGVGVSLLLGTMRTK